MGHSEPKKKANNENEQCGEVVPIPPDGGFGWVIVAASFLIHVITDGITYSFGEMYIELLSEFDEGKGYTSWILSLMCGMTLCSGPISSIFVNKYGCRAVTIAGAIFAAICLAVSYYAQNVLTLIITIGLGVGVGLGLIYLPAIVSVSTYFEKKRSIAIGIAVAGSGFGTFVFAPLVAFFIKTFHWRQTLLVLSGIVLNCALFGSLFRPLTATIQKTEQSDQNDQKSEIEPIQNGKRSENTQKHQFNSSQVPRVNSLITAIPEDGHMPRSQTVGHSMNSKKVQAKGRPDDTRCMLSQPLLTSSGFPTIYENRLSRRQSSGTLSRPDIFYQGSLYNIPDYKSQIELRTDAEYGANGIANEIESVSTEKICGCIPTDSDAFLEMLNFGLLTDPIFVVFALSNFSTCLGFYVPYFCLADKAKMLGLSTDEASYLLATIGIANTIGRIVLGYISDKSWINRLWVYSGCLFTCGLATIASVFCENFISLAVYSGTFGFLIGAYVGLTSVILVDLLGIGKLTNAFGLLLLFQGLASFIGPPIVGCLYDQSQSYVPGFLFAGSMIALSGFVLFFIPTLQRYFGREQTPNIDMIKNINVH